MEIKKRLEKIINQRKTLLGVGPMSLNVIDASIELSNQFNLPLMMIASRRQIDAKKFGGDNKNIVLSGHSAGAHLVSMMLSINWIKYKINPNIFKGIALVSGIFDTEIVLDLKVNDEIRLSNIEAIRNNPFTLKPKLNTKAIIRIIPVPVISRGGTLNANT